MRAIVVALALAGCASKPPPSALSPVGVAVDEIALHAEAACERACVDNVRAACVLAAIEEPAPYDCEASKSLACRLNCAP